MTQPLMPAEFTQLQQLMYHVHPEHIVSSTPPALQIASSTLPPPPLASRSATHIPPAPAPLPLTLASRTAPITHSYQSFHSQSPLGQHIFRHPDPHSPSASEPFLGFTSLASSAGVTGQVNQQRLVSSSATQPRQPPLPSHGHRCRGPAVRPPQLLCAPKIEDCVSDINGESVVRLGVKVYPLQVSTSVFKS